MTRGFRIARILGIDVYGDVSLVALAGILVWSLWAAFAGMVPAVSSRAAWALAVAGGALFFASILAHELSHSIVARRRGIGVRRIRLFIFGGVSELEGEAIEPGDELAIALAGPLASLVLGGLFMGGAFTVPDAIVGTDRLLFLLGFANLALAVFNLIPGYPLDGGRVLRALIWRLRGDRARATTIAVMAGRVVGGLLIGAGIVLALRPGGVLAGVWYLAIGWFLHQAAVGAGRREQLLARIAGMSVGEVMRVTPEAVPGDISVQEFVERYTFGTMIRPYPVAVDGRVRGVVGHREVESTAAADRSVRSVESVMARIGPEDVVEYSELLEDLLQRPAGPSRRAVVVRDGRVVGLVTGAELAFLWDQQTAANQA